MSVLNEWDTYERISDDPTDERDGVARQERDNEEAVTERGGRVVMHHTENDTSAYKQRRVTLTDPYGNTYSAYRVIRPVWAGALQRIRTGQSKRLMVWDLDRLARDPRDLEDAIELVVHYGAEIRSAVATEIDLSTESGQMSARLMVMIANKSSADTSRRVKRQKQERLAQGLPPGSRYRTFGYSRQWQLIEEEAQVVREIFKRIAKGESVNSVTKDLRERGTLTVSGKPFTFAATARVLDSPIYAGLLTYKGEITGKASVTALVSEAMLKSAAERATRPAWNTRKHLLSGIAICDACKTPMNFSGGAYVCSRMLNGCGRIRMKAEWLDDAVSHAVRFLAMWRRAHDSPAVESTPEIDPVDEIDQRLEEAHRAHAEGLLDLADLLPILKPLRAQRAKAVAAQAVDVGSSGWEAMEDYDSADLSLKRTILRQHVVAVAVSPSNKPGSNKYDPTRFKVVTAYKDDYGKDRVLAGQACDLLGTLQGAREFDNETTGEFPDLADDVIAAVWNLVEREQV